MDALKTDILIIGGGVAGAAAALAFKNSPFSITLIESQTNPAELNRGDVLHPATLEILAELSIPINFWEQHGGLPFQTFTAYHLNKPLLTVDYGKLNTKIPFSISLDHDKIQEYILQQAMSDRLKIHKGYTAIDIIEDRNGIAGAIIAKGEEQQLLHAQLIIGADGRNSFLRKTLEIVPTFEEFDDEVVFWLPLTQPWPNNGLYINPPHAVLTQILPPGNRLRVSVHTERGKGIQFIKQSPETNHQYLKTLSPHFADTEPKFSGEHIYATRNASMDFYYQGSAVLIGDAAHEVHPIATQGMAMAIADAYTLSQIIDNNLEDLEKKLARYQQIRKPINDEIAARTKLVALLLTRQFAMKKQIETALIEMVEHLSFLQGILSFSLTAFAYKRLGKADNITTI